MVKRTFNDLSDKELFDNWALPAWMWPGMLIAWSAPRNLWAQAESCGKLYIIGVERGASVAW